MSWKCTECGRSFHGEHRPECSRCPDGPAAIAAAKAEGAREATAAIVAWLEAHPMGAESPRVLASGIERGDHLKPGAR